MTPEEKANELRDKMIAFAASLYFGPESINKFTAEWVDEIVKAEPSKLVKARKYAHRILCADYWQQVKQELQNMK